MRFLKLPPSDWLIVLCLVIAIYILQNLALPVISSGYLATYVGRPILWVLLAVIILRLPRQRALGKGSLRRLLFKVGLGIGIFQVYLTFIAGFLEGFGRSPNSFTLSGVLINILFVSSNVIGLELSRAWLLNRWSRKPTYALPIVIALLFTLFNLSLNQIPKLNSDLETYTKFLGSEFLPLYMENYLASFLALWGGVWPAVVYRAVLEGVNWFSPVLPNLNWALKALTGTVVPIVGLVVIEDGLLSNIALPGKPRSNSDQGLVNWVLLSVFTVIAIWFSLGVFPFQPTAIVSGSMRPTFEVGDIVIVAKKNPNLLKVGDIIQFHGEETIPTVHRIISAKKEGGKKFFVTKGDANNGPDRKPVSSEKVVGTVIFILPKIGWVPITVRQLFL